ncbi:MAG: hypothetical protein Q9168_002869, partial [Polycauliona sp. 1 TL-2023]
TANFPSSVKQDVRLKYDSRYGMSCVQEDESQGKDMTPTAALHPLSSILQSSYRHPDSIIFRSMNATAENHSLKPKRRPRKAVGAKSSAPVSRSESAERQSHSSDSDIVLARQSARGLSERLTTPMPTDWDHQAICQFFDDYVITLDRGRGGYLSFLPDFYQQKQHVPYLTEALHAVSMASLANRTSMPHLVMRARKSYGNALTLVNAALSDMEQAKSDELLASLMLLTKYELISGDKTTLWESHTAGQIHLLGLRGEDQFKTDTGRELYRFILARQRLADLGYQRPPKLGANLPKENVQLNPHGARLANLIHSIGKLYGVIPQNKTAPPRHESFPQDWAYEVLALETEIRDWSETIPPFWGYRTIPPYGLSNTSPEDQGPIFPKAINIYTGMLQASAWNVLWCGRIHLLRIMLTYRSTLSPDQAKTCPLPAEESIRQESQHMADNICNNVPFVLGEVDTTGALKVGGRGKAIGPFMLIWALYVALSVESMPQSQRDWINGRLSYIGHVMGIQQAFVLRNLRASQRRASPRFPLSVERMTSWEQFR